MSFKDQPIGEYILQVNTVFRPKTINILGSFQVWKKIGLFGFGDDLMRFCPAGGCLGVFDFVFALTESELERINGEEVMSKWPIDIKARHDNWYNEIVVCPKCELSSPRALLSDSYGFNLPLKRIALKMEMIFEELDRNADIYLVKTKEDRLFHKAREYMHSQNFSMDKYTQMLEKARDRDQVLYPLYKIIKDAHSGSVNKRFLAMLRA